MSPLKKATLVFLVKRAQDGAITDVCLAMKKRGFGANRWNGVGGKVEPGETIENAAKREAKEEIGVEIMALDKVAELVFHFAHKPEWDQVVSAYISDSWNREPVESEEMSPKWFAVTDVPYKDMWPDDEYWLSIVLQGKKVKGSFTFDGGETVVHKAAETECVSKDVQIVQGF